MAASKLPKPGTEYGPCADPCAHVDCLETRNMSHKQCLYCETEIGYETRFYQLETGALVHARCHEEEIESIQLHETRHDQDQDDFRDPGGRSALRTGERKHPCPTCERPNQLTDKDVHLGYQCDACADELERGY